MNRTIKDATVKRYFYGNPPVAAACTGWSGLR
jgi:hypothetical protein